MVDTSHQSALGYMEVVQRCGAATLLHIIQAHIAAGTVVVHWYQWCAYNSVWALAHQIVNDSVTFVGVILGIG